MRKLLRKLLFLTVLLIPITTNSHVKTDCAKEAYKNLREDIVSIHFRDSSTINFLENSKLYKIETLIKLTRISNKHNINPEWLVKIIKKESGGIPNKPNPYSGAMGIIQWMPETAKYLGTSTKELSNMSVHDQLDYVDKYFTKVQNMKYVNSYHELYLSVFYPEALGKSDNYIIGSNNKLVAQNKAVDTNNDNTITVSDFKKYALD